MDSQNHQQKAQKREKCGIEHTKERILIYALRQEGGVSPQLGTCTSGDKFSAALCTSVKDCRSTTSTDLGVTNKFIRRDRHSRGPAQLQRHAGHFRGRLVPRPVCSWAQCLRRRCARSAVNVRNGDPSPPPCQRPCVSPPCSGLPGPSPGPALSGQRLVRL